MKLLIIEDSEMYASLVAEYLQELADEIVIAKNWEEAKHYVEMEHDVVWFDLHIPGLALDEMVMHIGEMRGRYQDTVIVVCSGYMDEPMRQRLRSLGADAVEDKHNVVTPEQIASLVFLGIMQAHTRRHGRAVKCSALLERASAFMSHAFPKVTQLAQ